MLHEVKVFDGSGNLKKVIPPAKLTKQFWNEFDEAINVYRKKQQGHHDKHDTGPIFEDGDEELYE